MTFLFPATKAEEARNVRCAKSAESVGNHITEISKDQAPQVPDVLLTH